MAWLNLPGADALLVLIGANIVAGLIWLRAWVKHGASTRVPEPQPVQAGGKTQDTAPPDMKAHP